MVHHIATKSCFFLTLGSLFESFDFCKIDKTNIFSGISTTFILNLVDMARGGNVFSHCVLEKIYSCTFSDTNLSLAHANLLTTLLRVTINSAFLFL